jgi:dihydroorotase
MVKKVFNKNYAVILIAFVIIFGTVSLTSCTRQKKVNEGALGNTTESRSFVIAFQPEPPFDETVYDYVIQNARYINPETGSDIEGMNIGILGESVAAVTRRSLAGLNIIDATGLVVAPGFIDIDSYDPNPFGVRYKIADGVTTNLMMHGGTRDAAAWYNYYARNPPNMNYGASNFITLIRAHIGYGFYAVMTNPDDLDRQANIVEENIRNGALGISMSPEYAPGVQGEEMLRLSNIAAKYNLTT